MRQPIVFLLALIILVLSISCSIPKAQVRSDDDAIRRNHEEAQQQLREEEEKQQDKGE